MAPDDADAPLTVSVAYSPRAGEVDEVTLKLAPGSTVGDALRASGLSVRHPGLALEALPVGVWGSFRDRSDRLRDRDRVELYRPLLVDPKEARRLRYRAQGKPARVRRG
jgi:putative ubiquitin-RnfH superfamily antitoxin RatB of RatAB toxin-antitoxin module